MSDDTFKPFKRILLKEKVSFWLIVHDNCCIINWCQRLNSALVFSYALVPTRSQALTNDDKYTISIIAPQRHNALIHKDLVTHIFVS